MSVNFPSTPPVSPTTSINYEGYSIEDQDRLPSIKTIMESCKGKYRCFGSYPNGREDWGYDEIFSLEESLSIMYAYLIKMELKMPYSSSTIGQMVSHEMKENGILVFNGDLHTDFFMLMKRLTSLREQGYLSEAFNVTEEDPSLFKIVFLGDYFGRGRDGIKLFMFLLLLKLENWNSIDLYRGNHEFMDLLEKEIAKEESLFLKNPYFRSLLRGVFSSLIIRGYYCCSTPTSNNRKEHLVVCHGIPGYYPFAIDVIRQKKLTVLTSDDLKNDKNVDALVKVNIEDFDWVNISNAEEKKSFSVLLIKKFVKENQSTIQMEWTKGQLLELWGDVSMNWNEIGPNNKRNVGFVFSPKMLKDILRMHSDKENRIVSIIKGHGHNMDVFTSGELDEKKGFIHQLPATGNHPLLSEKAGLIDVYYLLKVKPKMKDWILLSPEGFPERSNETLKYQPIKRSFYWSSKEMEDL